MPPRPDAEAGKARGPSRLRLFAWIATQAAREAIGHAAEFAFLGLIFVLIYGWAYLPRLSAAIVARPELASSPALPAYAFLAILAFLLLARPYAPGRRVFYAASGLGLRDEYRLSRLGFMARTLWMPAIVFLAGLPFALGGGRPGLRAAALFAFCLASHALAASLVFMLRLGRDGASYAAHAEAREEEKARKPRSAISVSHFLHGLRSEPSSLLLLGMIVVLEAAAAADLVAAGSADASRFMEFSDRGRAILIFCSTLSATFLIEHFSRLSLLFYRVLPLSFASYAIRRYPPLIALAFCAALPLIVPMAIFFPGALAYEVASSLLLALAAAFLGQSHPARPALASIFFAIGGPVLAALSLFRPALVLAVLVAIVLLLLRSARKSYYREEVSE